MSGDTRGVAAHASYLLRARLLRGDAGAEFTGLDVLRFEHDVLAVLDLKDHRAVDFVLSRRSELDRAIESLEPAGGDDLSYRLRIDAAGLLDGLQQDLASRRCR